MDGMEWLKNVPSSDLLLHELVMRGLPDSAKQVFRDCRLVKPLYFVDGVVFSEPQLLAANQFGPERYFILGRFADYSTFLMETIVIDFRGASPVVGLMALEEADDCVYERHCMTVSPSFERYFHDSVCLENMPDSFYDARDFKTDLSWV